jgi:primosomal replication protein N
MCCTDSGSRGRCSEGYRSRQGVKFCSCISRLRSSAVDPGEARVVDLQVGHLVQGQVQQHGQGHADDAAMAGHRHRASGLFSRLNAFQDARSTRRRNISSGSASGIVPRSRLSSQS